MTTLYDYWRSSASYRVRIALNLLGLSYTAVPVNLVEGAQRAPENLARNPQGLVPTLEIDGLTLTQSLAIIEYLNDSHGGLLPADATGRARVRALSYAVAMEIAPICNLSVRTHVAALTGGAFTADDWQRHYISAGLAAVERMLDAPQTGAFCHGDKVTMADICLMPQIYNAERVGLDVASWPTIARIRARLETIPAVQAAHPDKVKP
ncbi:maleylacetoacetate isomerase [Rhodobacter sp. SGA-6-6]|uniref:maleylacetoacetate isomerase n=1 Tax=Rhodobacter sp. SGA-6-6 TaxID=2710882 RepID=UPI0013ED35C7|nr:maleylacetoacetate isomerase [Rhodobacter sp. SGA-6-6]NGM44256.1 maleylacetoacetate isomerase [Rhodobacter sp. SGA-6-6]